MTTIPRRRWFRFKLSTLLVLVAIAAWAMAHRPYFPQGSCGLLDYLARRAVLHAQAIGKPVPLQQLNVMAAGLEIPITDNRTGSERALQHAKDFWKHPLGCLSWYAYRLNPGLISPLLILCEFCIIIACCPS